MPKAAYRARGPEKRTTQITVRVSPSEREMLRQSADQRGETVSSMLMSAWKAAEAKKRRKGARKSGHAVRRVDAPATAPQAQTREQTDARLGRMQRQTHVKDVVDGQTSIFDIGAA